MSKFRGFIKLKKGLVGNLHPLLSFLDKKPIPFQGWFDLDHKFFFIEFGNINNGRYEKTIVSPYPENIVNCIKEHLKGVV